MPTYALEITMGQTNQVFREISPLIQEAHRLKWFGLVLNSDIWIVISKLTRSSSLRVPGVLNIEGAAEHVFYGFPRMREATEPGIERLTPEEVGEIVAPTPNVNVAANFPFGTVTFRLGPEVDLNYFTNDGSWDRTLDFIGAKRAWSYNRGEGSIIAVIDSGIEGDRLAPGQLANTWSSGPGINPFSDAVGHGTMVGLLATARPWYSGFSGVAPAATLFVLKPRPDVKKHIMSTHDLMIAIDHALGFGIQANKRVILNNSWGLWGCKSLLLPCKIILTRALVAADRTNKILVVWAAGNNEMLGCNTGVSSWCMNSLATSVNVGAVNLDLALQPYSSVGGQCYPLTPTVVCPTGGPLPWGNGFRDMGDFGGFTSACAAQVSGAMALLNTAHPGLTNTELRAALRASARRLGPDPDFNPGTGSGLLQIDRAIIAAPTARRDPSFLYEQVFLDRVSTVK